jgi:ABC-type transport system involved in multi-copper enzyme maturation permease subunit
MLWTAAGASAIFAVLLPILADLGQFSLRRIWAVARLSFKEAVRRKVLWVFLALLLVVLFGSWFIPHKPEDQVRDYVIVVFTAMSLIMLFLAGLIAAFGIPDDIRHQTIHTVLTKPVQRFEIFLGRFLGYVLLMTAALVAVSGIGLLYVLRNIEPEAAEESLKARQPFYGKLSYIGTRDKEKGENVGREWQYRGYISGRSRTGTDPTQYAVWSFQDLPAALANQDRERMEFTLDIYRTHKGVEGQGIFATFFIESWRFDPDNPAMMQKYNTRKKELEDSGQPADVVASTLAKELGYYEYPSMEIKDFHTQYIEVPAGVIQNALEPDKERQEELRRRREWPVAPLRVRVRCDSPAQFLGMAPYDLYFRLDSEDPTGTTNKLRFCVNFFKGSFGLWLRLCLLLGLAVALSTYLSGVITLLTAGSLFVLGFFHEFIIEVATRRNLGGGPVESAMRLLKRPGGEPIAGQLEESASTQVATGLDTAFSWSLSLIKNVIPDVARYNFTDFVAEGVAISGGQMIMTLLLLAGYVLPCAVLAYYLLKWREVASST